MTWTNWVGNQSFAPVSPPLRATRTRSSRSSRRRPGAARGVRVAGAGHSFTPVVQTDGLLLDVSAMRGVVGTDRAQAGDRAPRHADP